MTSRVLHKASTRIFTGLMGLFAGMARDPASARLLAPVLRLLARCTVRVKGLRAASNMNELAEMWQRAFPSPKGVPIVEVTGDTVIAEITPRCPLRGSGDTSACHRLMGFDRELMKTLGGTFVVLRSQAEPGVTSCRVAIRKAGLPAGDLVPAHERAPGGRP